MNAAITGNNPIYTTHTPPPASQTPAPQTQTAPPPVQAPPIATQTPPPEIQTPPAASTNQKLIVTPENTVVGKVATVNQTAGFVVLSFPVGHVPPVDQRLSLYRRG